MEAAAYRYIATGYQTQLTYEVPGGGFSLFGKAPADPFLTAYGLMEFADMAGVYDVDEEMIDRTARWLMSQQQSDGGWKAPVGFANQRPDADLLTAAYVTWALIEAGYQDTSEVRAAIRRIRRLNRREEDPYGLAIIANALTAYDKSPSSTRTILRKLHGLRNEDGDTVYWQNTEPSYMGASGPSGRLETTALVAAALIRAQAYPEDVRGALSTLIQSKDSEGTWGSTQATIYALKALLMAAPSATSPAESSTVRVSLNDDRKKSQEIVMESRTADLVHLLTFDDGLHAGTNELRLDVEGRRDTLYQVATTYYVPWESSSSRGPEGPIALELDYDRTRLMVHEVVSVRAQVRPKDEGWVRMALVELGVPPGFTLLEEDLRQMVKRGTVARYESTDRHVILYIENLYGPIELRYRMRADLPIRAQVPPSRAYDYYNPGEQTTLPPVELVVSLQEGDR